MAGAAAASKAELLGAMADLFNRARHGSVTQSQAELMLDNLEYKLRLYMNTTRTLALYHRKRQMKTAAGQAQKLAAQIGDVNENPDI